MIALQAGMRVLVATKPVDFRRGADSLGSFDQGSLRLDIAGLGNDTTPHPAATRVLGRHQAKVGHQLPRIAKPGKVTDLCHHRHGISSSTIALCSPGYATPLCTASPR